MSEISAPSQEGHSFSFRQRIGSLIEGIRHKETGLLVSQEGAAAANDPGRVDSRTEQALLREIHNDNLPYADRLRKWNELPAEVQQLNLPPTPPPDAKKDSPDSSKPFDSALFEREVQKQMKTEEKLLKQMNLGMGDYETRRADRERQVRGRLEQNDPRFKDRTRREDTQKSQEQTKEIERQMRIEEVLLKGMNLGEGDFQTRLAERRREVESRVTGKNAGVPYQERMSAPAPQEKKMTLQDLPLTTDPAIAAELQKNETRLKELQQKKDNIPAAVPLPPADTTPELDDTQVNYDFVIKPEAAPITEADIDTRPTTLPEEEITANNADTKRHEVVANESTSAPVPSTDAGDLNPIPTPQHTTEEATRADNAIRINTALSEDYLHSDNPEVNRLANEIADLQGRYKSTGISDDERMSIGNDILRLFAELDKNPEATRAHVSADTQQAAVGEVTQVNQSLADTQMNIPVSEEVVEPQPVAIADRESIPFEEKESYTPQDVYAELMQDAYFLEEALSAALRSGDTRRLEFNLEKALSTIDILEHMKEKNKRFRITSPNVADLDLALREIVTSQKGLIKLAQEALVRPVAITDLAEDRATVTPRQVAEQEEVINSKLRNFLDVQQKGNNTNAPEPIVFPGEQVVAPANQQVAA